MLHPLLESIAAGARNAPLPPLRSLAPAEARARIAALRRSTAVEVPGVGVSDGEIAGIPVRWYTPDDSRAETVVVYLHSGGWVLGGLDAPDPMLRKLALETGLRYVSVDYRLAPEHPYPGALEDVQAVLDEVTRDGGCFILHGDSAGGNLAAVIASRYRGDSALQALVLVYPVTDCDMERGSYLRRDLPSGFLEPEDMHWFWSLYAGDADRTDPGLSPLRGDLAGLPKTVVVTAEFDPLRDEGHAYAQAAAEQGVDVVHLHAGDCTHGFIQMTGVLDRADEFRRAISSEIREIVGESALGQGF